MTSPVKINSVMLITPDHFKCMPWKNGKGQTTELICINNPQSKQVLWRISMATVSEDGDFSDFTGFERTLVLLTGNGIDLTHDGHKSHALHNQYDHCVFNGGCTTHAKLVDGPITDFNIIYDINRVTANICIGSASQSKTFGRTGSEILIFAHQDSGQCSVAKNHKSIQFDIPQNHLLHVSATHANCVSMMGAGLIGIDLAID